MLRSKIAEPLNVLGAYLSGEHGDHEGGYAGNCQFCALLALVEVMGGIMQEIDPDEWDTQ